MKLLVVEPAEDDLAIGAKADRIKALLTQSGHKLVTAKADRALFGAIIKAQPDAVFNLASAFDCEKANRLPALFEIARVRYTGSGVLALSLCRFYNLLFPLLHGAGVPCVPFRVVKAGSGAGGRLLKFPLQVFHEGERSPRIAASREELDSILASLPAHDDALLMPRFDGHHISTYILGEMTLGCAESRACELPARKAYGLVEARGLARFDFMVAPRPLLCGMDCAPDPLEAELVRCAMAQGLNERVLLERMLADAGRD